MQRVLIPLYCIAVGRALAQANIGLVYGGGRRGLMGGVAFGCAQAGGNVLGVVPRAIQASGGEGTGPVLASRNEEDEAVWTRTKTVVVQSMHERKLTMADHSGAFIGLPGGFGTFEEVSVAHTLIKYVNLPTLDAKQVLEVITWNQLGIHLKRMRLLSITHQYY